MEPYTGSIHPGRYVNFIQILYGSYLPRWTQGNCTGNCAGSLYRPGSYGNPVVVTGTQRWKPSGSCGNPVLMVQWWLECIHTYTHTGPDHHNDNENPVVVEMYSCICVLVVVDVCVHNSTG